MKIGDITYIAALFGLMIGIPLELETAYPMLADYDPFGLSLVIPILCMAGLFAGLVVVGKMEPGSLKSAIKWFVLLAFTGFSFVALNHSLAETYDHQAIAFAYHLFGPALAWGWQGFCWYRDRNAPTAPMS